MKKRFCVLILCFSLLFLTVVSAQNYYADVEIVVDETGSTTITGTTNHPTLLTQNNPNYTSKKAQLWLLNFTSDTFSDAIFTLHLPKNAQITYLKTPQLSRIEHTNSNLNIIGTAQNQPLNIVVQYTIAQTVTDYFILSLILSIVVIAGAIIIIVYKKRIKQPLQEKTYHPASLTPREQQIVQLLTVSNHLTQKQLEEQTNLPKSTLSRTITRLEQKGIIKKEQKGMTNLIYLK